MSGVRLVAARESLAVFDKPPSLPTEPEDGFESSLLDEAAALWHVPRRQLHAHTRLDVGVSGAVLVSRASDLRKRLAEPDAICRQYAGIVAGKPAKDRGEWTGSIGRRRRGSYTVGGHGARSAHTRYVVIASVSTNASQAASLIGFELVTGRTHQIRVHAADAGMPVFGDRRYGGARRFAAAEGTMWELERIALHAIAIEIRLEAQPWRVIVPPPDELVDVWKKLGGDPDDWGRAAESRSNR